ncbi:MAG: TldD/PmbA family protein [Candidatus Bipolaricaulota bacterium]
MSILKLAGERAEAAELYDEVRQGLGVHFHGGEIEAAGSEAIHGRALRVIAGGKLGFASTAGGSDEALVQSALGAAAHGDPAPFKFSTPKNGESVPVLDPQVSAISVEELISWGEEAVRAIRDEFPELVVNASLGRGTVDVSVRTTAGGERQEQRSYLSMSLDVEQVREGDIWSVYATRSVRRAADLDRGALLEEVLRYLRWGREIATPPAGTPPVLFAPTGFPVLLLPLMVGFSGLSVFLGTSPLKGRLGEAAFDSRLSITDDGTIPFGSRSRTFDDEGLPTGRLPLVEGGVVKSFYYDLRAAALAKAEPTGNGIKGGPMGTGGFRVPPGPASRNIVVSPGEGSLDDLVAEMKDGLIVAGVLGLGQGNVQSGAFSNNVGVGFAVKGGKVVGRVKNTMIAGNAYEVLKDGIRAIGGTADWVYGGLHVPPVLAQGVSVVVR